MKDDVTHHERNEYAPAAEEAEPTPESSSSEGSTAVGAAGRFPKKLLALGALAVVTIVLLAVGACYYFPVFKVSHVAVEGTEQVENQLIQDASGVQMGENLLRVDASEVARNVAALPRVREVTVGRQLPGTLKVSVVEQRVVGWVEEADGPALIDERGTVFYDGTPPQSSVRVEGADLNDVQQVEGIVSVAGSLPNHLRMAMDHLRVNGPFEFVLYFKDGKRVVWGAPLDNENKTVALETVLKREGDSFDVSNPSMVVAQ